MDGRLAIRGDRPRFRGPSPFPRHPLSIATNQTIIEYISISTRDETTGQRGSCDLPTPQESRGIILGADGDGGDARSNSSIDEPTQEASSHTSLMTMTNRRELLMEKKADG